MNNETMKKSNPRRTPLWRQWLLFVVNSVLLLLIVLVVRAFVATIFTVPDNSMAPLLGRGDRVLVNRLAAQTFKQGDLVVFGDSSCFIGRVQGVPGDTIIWGGEQYLIPRKCHEKCDCGVCNIFLVDMGRGQTLVQRGDIIGKAHRLFKGIGSR